MVGNSIAASLLVWIYYYRQIMF